MKVEIAKPYTIKSQETSTMCAVTNSKRMFEICHGKSMIPILRLPDLFFSERI